jgi:hypothetical protein
VSAGAAEDEEAIARAVEAGTDRVAVPRDLLDEETRRVEPSLLLRVRTMTVTERIKLALRGNREARMVLVRDTNPVIRRLVLRNPRIGVEELLAIASARTADDEQLRTIAESRDWTANYQIRHALVTNPKTPLVTALRLLGSLQDRDLRRIAKSKNVPATVSAQARRIVLNRPR